MTMKTDQFNELHRKNMEIAMRLAQFSIDNSQRLMSLQTELAKTLFEEGVANARAQTGAKDPMEVMRLRAEYAQETTKKMIAAAQEMAMIGNDARSEFSRMLTEQLASGSKDMSEGFQSFLKSLPGSSPNMMETMQQAIASANSAFEQIAKVSAATMSSVGEMTKKATGAGKRK
jgi:phasin family protein